MGRVRRNRLSDLVEKTEPWASGAMLTAVAGAGIGAGLA